MRLKRTRVAMATVLAAFTLAGAALPLSAQAQNLQALYDAARAFDATYLAARQAAEAAKYRAEQGEALNRPSAALSASATNSQIDAPRIPTGSSVSTGVTVNGKMPLFNRANDASVAQSRKSLVVAQADLDAAEQDLIVRVSQAYFDVLTAQDTLTTTRANKTFITEQLASAKRNFEVGTATITDTREAQARFDLATAQELVAENDLRTKRIALDTLVGRTNTEPKPLATPVVLPSPVPANAEEWVTVADNQHPTVRKARVGLEVATLETAKAKAGHLPTVDAVASVGSTRADGTSLAAGNGKTNTGTVGLQLNWTLFAGGAIQNRVKETLALEEKAKNDVEAARRGVAQGTRVAYFGVQSGLSQVKALEAAESSSKLALEATQLGYKVGVRVNLDVLNAQTQLFSTQRDLAKARYDVLLAGLKLRQASGQLAPTDLDSVNRLLAP
ncbi:MAG: TolC family outer membrane protein [Rubrivivax sp.]